MLVSVSHAVSRLSRRLRKERHSDLTPTQLSALGALLRNGPLTLGALARHENVQPPFTQRGCELMAHVPPMHCESAVQVVPFVIGFVELMHVFDTG